MEKSDSVHLLYNSILNVVEIAERKCLLNFKKKIIYSILDRLMKQ